MPQSHSGVWTGDSSMAEVPQGTDPDAMPVDPDRDPRPEQESGGREMQETRPQDSCPPDERAV